MNRHEGRRPKPRPSPKRRRKRRPSVQADKIKPGADPKLRRVFGEIGVPPETPFQPDPFQLEALSAIDRADCLVTAPTGAGKTWIAESAIEKIHAKGGSAWYASPLKALSNSIYAKFRDRFGPGHVGILTGDRKENPEAPIIVGTTEILRNHLYDAMWAGEDLKTDFVILDEAHFLGDEDRGVVWEEIMIYLPVRIPLLMLSATVGNARQIADWLQSIRKRECTVIEEKTRPVPLYPLFFHPSGTLMPLVVHRNQSDKLQIYQRVHKYLQDKKPERLAPPGKLPPMGDIIRTLRKYNLLPAIFFMKSRADCDQALELCTEESLLEDPDRRERLGARASELTGESPHIAHHKQLWHLEHLAVGSHHSGQLPAWKIIIETLMTEGLLDAVFATSTVAAGVNFPARTVVILNSDRFNGTEFRPLTPTEFHQMTGRSGRRGMDNIGFATMLPGPFMDLRLIAKLIQADPSDVLSQIRINFSMVLNLLRAHTPAQIKELLEKSFAAFLLAKSKKKKRERLFVDNQNYLWRDFIQHLTFLKDTGFVSEKDELTEDGNWASQLRIDQPLMVAEGFRRGIFPESDPPLLAAIIAAFVNERENADERIANLEIPKSLLNHFLTVKRVLRPFAKMMISGGFGVKPLCLRPAAALYAWADDQPWEKVVSIADLTEGDLARLILRTADNLRHIRNLSKIFPRVAKTAGVAIDSLMRDPLL